MSLAEVARIGPYRVERRLGAGGGGVVYLARREGDRSPTALKTVPAVRPERIEMLRREIRAISRISHPDVIQVIEDGVDNGRPWYSMAYLEVPTLSTWIGQLWADTSPQVVTGDDTTRMDGPSPHNLATTLSLNDSRVRRATEAGTPELRVHTGRTVAAGRLDEALTVIAALCRPLAFVHGEGIVHRDIKPSNVFLPTTRRAILADFGLATNFEGATGRGTVDLDTRLCGTVAYMAPEQVEERVVDARADLYSVGCILYELLTGRPPFGGGVSETLLAHVGLDPIPPSTLVNDVPEALEHLVLKLLEKDPANRIPYADTLARSLASMGAQPIDLPPAPRPRPYLYRPQFINRDFEHRRLTELLSAAMHTSQHTLCLLVGESGIGKSRIAAELGAEARRQQISVVAGECQRRLDSGWFQDAAADTPLAPLRPLLQRIAEQCHEAGPSAARELIGDSGRLLIELEPTLSHLLPAESLPELPALPPELAQQRLLNGLASVLQRLAESEGFVLILDDLQWADDLTLAFLEFLCSKSAPPMRLLVVGTVRSEETPSRVVELMQGAQVITLGRLDDQHVRSVVADMLASKGAADQLTQALAQQSEGNPFFVGEYLRAAVASEVIQPSEKGGWRVVGREAHGPNQELPLPGALRDLLGFRLKGLPATARALVMTASVLGRTFDAELCRTISGLSEDEAYLGERELVARQILRWDPDGRLRFDHGKIRELTYEALDPATRRRLHGAAARALESVAEPNLDGDHDATLGHHWSAAGEPARAVEHLVRAGHGARMVPSMRAAAQYDRAAIEQLRLAGEAARGISEAALLEELADVLELDGQHEEARSCYHQAATHHPADAYLDRARLLRKESRVWEVQHAHAEELDALDRAIALLEEHHGSREGEWEAEWLENQVRRATVFYFQDRIAEMNQVVEAIESTVADRGDAKQQAILYHLASNAKNRGNRFVASSEVVDLARRAAELIEQSDDFVQKVFLRFDLGFALLWHGDVEGAVGTLERALELSRMTGDMLLICRCLVYLGVALRRRRDAAAVEAVASEAMEVARAGEFEDYIACASSLLGWLHLERSERAAARRHVNAAVDRWRALAKTYPYPFQWLALLPHLELALEDADAAEWQTTARELLASSQLRLPEPLEAALLAVSNTDARDTRLRERVEQAIVAAREQRYL